MAQSVKIDFNIWSQFDHHAYDIIHQDFVHQNLLRVNANILSSKGRIRLQETLLQKKEQFTTTGQTNILFPFNSNKWLYFQCRTKGFRIHFDNGLFPRGHLQHNVYASFQSTRKMTENMFKIGCETVAGNWRYNLRYRYAAQDQSHTLYSKWRYDYHNWTFEGIKALDLNNLILLKNNLLIGYYQGNKTYHLRLEKQGWRTQPIDFKKIRLADLFESATFNFTKTLNANQRVGIETGIKTTGQVQPFSLVWEAYDPILHRTLKLKASSNNSAALSLRNPLGSYGSYILGIGIDNFGSQNNVNFGVLVDLNL